MSVLNIILAILLFISAIFLIIAVLLQSGKSKGVSGAITGGSSETYFGKNKGKSSDKKLSLLTTIVAIVFVVLALVAYVTQDYIDQGDYWENLLGNSTSSSKVTTSSVGTASSDTEKSDVNTSTTDSSVTASVNNSGDTNPDVEGQ